MSEDREYGMRNAEWISKGQRGSAGRLEAWKVKVKKRLKAESSKECPWPLEAEKLKAELLTMIPV